MFFIFSLYISFTFSLKRTMDIVVGGKVVCVCGYGEVRRVCCVLTRHTVHHEYVCMIDV